MTLALNVTPGQTFSPTNNSNVSTLARGYTTTVPNCLAVVVVEIMNITNGGTPATVTSITDTAGLTWTLRKRVTGTSTSGFGVAYEIWYATHTTASANTVTAHFSAATNAAITTFALSGVPNLANPWDGNSSFPASVNTGSSTTAPTISGLSTSSTNAFVFATWFNGSTNTSTAGSILGSSATQDFYNSSASNAFGSAFEHVILSASASGSATFTGGQSQILMYADAISGDAGTNATGTITTALTKASIAASGNMKASGTIATHLSSGPKLSLSAAQKMQGTIATHLTAPSQSASGSSVLQPRTGTITTSLTKPSQTASGTVINPVTGTATTHLSGISQQALGSEVQPSATITTKLFGLSQSATGHSIMNATGTIAMQLGPFKISATAREIISGTITTHLGGGNGFASGIVAQELIIGTAVTRLGPISQHLAGYELVDGTITTKLGGGASNLLGNTAGGQVIISGPIVMNLRYGITQLLLGGKLKDPGTGQWQTWRYTDS